jgi:hypothetical protein
VWCIYSHVSFSDFFSLALLFLTYSLVVFIKVSGTVLAEVVALKITPMGYRIEEMF